MNKNKLVQTKKVGNMEIVLPFVELPKPFVVMLSKTFTAKDAIPEVSSIIRSNKALDLAIEKGFSDFKDGRGLEKFISALGWPNFRDRLASIFVQKSRNGVFPEKTDMQLITDLKDFESYYVEHSVHSNSRIFLLAFYLKLARITEFPDLISYLNISQARSEKLDWILLILAHFNQYLGKEKLSKHLASHMEFQEIFMELNSEQQQKFHSNMLAYGMSIGDSDIFLYEKV